VHEARLPLQRLNEVRLERLLEQHRHRPGGAEVLGGDRPAAVIGVRHGDRAQAPPQVADVARHGQDGHDLGGGGDVEARLTRVAVGPSPQADDDLAKRSIVHVDHPPPCDAQRVDLVHVAVQDGGVEQRRKQIVGRPDGMDVAGEVQVEVLHRHDLGQPSARRAALDAEHRAQRRLAQAQDRALADRPEPLRERHGRGRLALPGPGGRHAGHADELAVGHVRQPVERRQRNLALVPAVRLDLVRLEADALGYRLDRLQLGVLGDLEAALHRLPFL
jgi:hypothetical protein